MVIPLRQVYITDQWVGNQGQYGKDRRCCTERYCAPLASFEYRALGSLKLPSGELRNKKSINLVYVRPGYKGQTA